MKKDPLSVRARLLMHMLVTRIVCAFRVLFSSKVAVVVAPRASVAGTLTISGSRAFVQGIRVEARP